MVTFGWAQFLFCAICSKNECAALVQSFGNFCLNALYEQPRMWSQKSNAISYWALWPNLELSRKVPNSPPPPPPQKKKPTSSNAPSPNWPLFEKKCRFFATTPWKEKKNAEYWKRPFEKKKKKRLEHRQNVSHFDASVVTQVDGSVSHWFVSRCSWSLKKKKDTEEQYIRRTETQKPWSLMLEGRGRLAEKLR